MSQVSRPVQIALLAVLLIGALWFVALRPHSQTASTPTPAPVAAVPPTAPKQLNTKTPVVGGLFGAVNKANAAVANSSANATALERKSAAASSSANPSPAPVTTASSTAAAPAATTPTTHATTAPSTQTSSHAGTATKPATAPTSPAVTIGNELAQGKTVALLFWNPLATDDRAVRAALKVLVKRNGPLVAHYATAAQVTDYGSIVTASQVLETPTLLVMKGKNITTITDLQDPSDLRQYFGNFVQGGPGQVLTPTLAAYATGTTRTAYIATANAVCKRFNAKQEQLIASSGTTTPGSALKAAVTVEQSYLAALKAIPPPPADRAYLHTTWVAIDRSVAQTLTEIVAVGEGNDYAAHNLALSSEDNADLAYNRLNTYGLSDCAGPDSPNLTP